MLCLKRTRETGICLLTALLVEILLCSFLLKPLIGRVRPCVVKDGVSLLIGIPRDASFPSGHTAAACAAACVFRIRRNRLWVFLAPLALMIGFSRLYLYVHYPTDVLAGAFIGCAIAFLVCKEAEKLIHIKSAAG